jgi:hypothetical protein
MNRSSIPIVSIDAPNRFTIYKFFIFFDSIRILLRIHVLYIMSAPFLRLKEGEGDVIVSVGTYLTHYTSAAPYRRGHKGWHSTVPCTSLPGRCDTHTQAMKSTRNKRMKVERETSV